MVKKNLFKNLVLILCFCLLIASLNAQNKIPETVLSQKLINDIINEVSGSLPYNNINELGAYNRDRKEEEYKGTYWESEFIEKMAKLYGFSDVHIERIIPESFNRPQWDAEVGELWMVEPEKRLIISYRDEPTCLAVGSKSCDVTAELVFIGSGTKDEEYEKIDVSGKIVLATGSGESWGGATRTVYAKAVNENGALGVVVFKTARPFEFPDQIPWAGISGWIGGKIKENTFGFNLTHRIGYELMELLLNGEKIKVRVKVKTDEYLTDQEIPTAIIPGKTEEELVYVAHLFEGVTKQGAIDNFSGCAVIMEAGRTIIELIEKGILPQPERTIRFLWTPEIFGTFLYMQKYPEEVKNMIAAINLDMVGEDMQRMMNSLNMEMPKYSHYGFLGDIVKEFFEYTEFTNMESWYYSRGGYINPIIDIRGSQDPFRCRIEPYGGASDHMVFMSPMFKIPSVCFNNWPDKVYHSNQDRAYFADPTQLKRAAFIAAASGITIAYAKPENVIKIGKMMFNKSVERIAEDIGKFSDNLFNSERTNLHNSYKEAKIGIEQAYKRELNSLNSLEVFAKDNSSANIIIDGLKESLKMGEKGHLELIKKNYEILCEKYNIEPEKIVLTETEKEAAKMIPVLTLKSDNIMSLFRLGGKITGSAGDELLCFTDGERSILEIRNAVSAEFYPLKIEDVIEHFKQLEKRGAVEIKEK